MPKIIYFEDLIKSLSKVLKPHQFGADFSADSCVVQFLEPHKADQQE
jgi:hypothetical protein